MLLYVIIPAHNEENTIGDVIKDVLKYVKNIIVINDDSTDDTYKICQAFQVQIINNPKKAGYAKSLEIGLKAAFVKGADYAISFDADGQHKGSDLLRIKSILAQRKPDIVVGKRLQKNRRMEYFWGNYAKNKYGISDPLCGLKAFSRKIFQKYGYLERSYTIGTELLFKALKDGADIEEVDINVGKRKDNPRFANYLIGNCLELRAFLNILRI